MVGLAVLRHCDKLGRDRAGEANQLPLLAVLPCRFKSCDLRRPHTTLDGSPPTIVLVKQGW